MGHQNDLCPLLPHHLQKIQQLPGGAGVGEEKYGVPGGQCGGGDGLEVGVVNRLEVGEGRGKEMGCLHGHDHGAALPHTQHPPRLFQDRAGGGHVLRPDQRQCLGQGLDVVAIELLAHLLDAVLRGGLSGWEVLPHPLDGGVGHRQFKGVVALVPQSAAEAGDRSLRHATLLRQFRDGHELRVIPIADYIVGHLFLRGGELVVFAADLLENVSPYVLHPHHLTGCPAPLSPAPGSDRSWCPP